MKHFNSELEQIIPAEGRLYFPVVSSELTTLTDLKNFIQGLAQEGCFGGYNTYTKQPGLLSAADVDVVQAGDDTWIVIFSGKWIGIHTRSVTDFVPSYDIDLKDLRDDDWYLNIIDSGQGGNSSAPLEFYGETVYLYIA